MNWLRDTWNGLVVILLKPYLPKRGTVAALVIGVLIGLVWAYGIAPTIFYNADPLTLQQTWQDEWVKLLADRGANANAVVGDNIQQLLTAVDHPLEIVDRLSTTPGEEANQARLQSIRPYAEAAEPFAPIPPGPNLLQNILPFIIAPLIALLIVTIVIILWSMFIRPNVWDPLMRRIRGEKTSAEVIAMRQQVAASRQAEASQKTDFAVTTVGKPIIQRMSTYFLGRGNYDDSFGIEDEDDKFYGECGAGISQTIGTGDVERATAVEVWMFDKDDITTLTKVFATEYAFNDPATRAKLEPKGEIVLAQPGAVITIESNALRLQARIVEMEYGTGTLAPRSFFQKLTIEMAAWHKDGASAMTPANMPVPPVQSPIPPGIPAQQTFAPPAYAPMPAPVQPMAPAVVSTGQPLIIPPGSVVQPAAPPPRYVPPPAVPLPHAEDDPFGGTGDFTPIR